jgi:hypothetical protein
VGLYIIFDVSPEVIQHPSTSTSPLDYQHHIFLLRVGIRDYANCLETHFFPFQNIGILNYLQFQHWDHRRRLIGNAETFANVYGRLLADSNYESVDTNVAICSLNITTSTQDTEEVARETT